MSDSSTFIDPQVSDPNSILSEVRDGILATFGKARRKTVVSYSSGPQTLAEDVDLVVCDASGGDFTVNLPASPSDGDEYELKTVSTGTVTIGRNGSTIDGAASDYSLTGAGNWVILTYDSGDWITRAK